MRKILLFGKNGQLGWELNRSLQPLGDVVAFGREEADFSDPQTLRKIVQTVNPDVIVNAVAYTAVDKAEAEEALAATINKTAPSVLAEAAQNLGALLIHYSTDYVFDGAKVDPYIETDVPNPGNAYGRTKLAGEQVIQASGCDYLIFRTSWVYAARGHNFLLTILRLAAERDELSIVADQIGSPTSARLIADSSALCLQQSVKERMVGLFSSDLYHLTASGETSWHGFAEKIVQFAEQILHQPLKISRINAIPTLEYPTPAKRPLNSRLQLTRLENNFGVIMPTWETTLQCSIAEVRI